MNCCFLKIYELSHKSSKILQNNVANYNIKIEDHGMDIKRQGTGTRTRTTANICNRRDREKHEPIFFFLFLSNPSAVVVTILSKNKMSSSRPGKFRPIGQAVIYFHFLQIIYPTDLSTTLVLQLPSHGVFELSKVCKSPDHEARLALSKKISFKIRGTMFFNHIKFVDPRILRLSNWERARRGL